MIRRSPGSSLAAAVLAVLLLAACKQDRPPASKSGGTTATPERASAGKALVNADNGSAEELVLQVDGKEWAKIRPYSVIGFELSAGKRVLAVLAGGQEVDRAEVEVKAGELVLFNPRGLSAYKLVTYTYSSMPMVGFGRGPSSESLGSPRLLQRAVDYDLFHANPATVRIRVAYPGAIGTATRTKLYRVMPREMPAAQAAGLLLGSPEAVEGGDRSRAMETLLRHPADPAIQTILLGLAESKDSYLAGKAAAALADKYPAAVTEARLVGWLGQTTLAATATRMLVARGKADLLAREWGRIPAASRPYVLGALDHKSPPALRRALILAALSDSGAESTVRQMLHAKDLELDRPFAEAIEAHIACTASQAERKSWGHAWGIKLCRSAKSLPADWLAPRLVALLKGGSDLADEALVALVELGRAEDALPLWPGLADRARIAGMHRLRGAGGSGPAPAAVVAVALRGLEDPEKQVREMAFHLLAQRGLGHPGVPEAVTAALAREPDRGLRQRMEQAQLQALEGKLRGASAKELLDVAAGGPSPAVVNRAMDLLFRDYQNRLSHLAELVRRYPALRSADQRAWLLAALRGWSVVEGSQKLFDLGLADPEAGVRAAAARSNLGILHAVGPESEKVLETLQALPPALRDPGLKEYHLWLVPRLKQALRGRETRAGAQQKLLALGGDLDEQVALAALGELSFLKKEDADLLPGLEALYRKSGSAQRRQRILSDVQFVRDDRTLPIFRLGLADPDRNTRNFAFHALATGYREWKSPEIPALLREAAARETDARTRRDWERALGRLAR